MPIIRFGGVATAAARARGIISSSNGSASDTPAARRKKRREIGGVDVDQRERLFGYMRNLRELRALDDLGDSTNNN